MSARRRKGIARLAASLAARHPARSCVRKGRSAPAGRRSTKQRCIGCTLCIKACPVDCIVGAPKRMHTVVAADCTGCELCLSGCARWTASTWRWPPRDAAAGRHGVPTRPSRPDRPTGSATQRRQRDPRRRDEAPGRGARVCPWRGRGGPAAQCGAGRPGACEAAPCHAEADSQRTSAACRAQLPAMKIASIEPFFAALRAANPQPATELEFTTCSNCWPPCCCRRRPPTSA